ncbi:styrene monooxygenase/indole monooxygenase family protein [Haloactinospora alba]|nr:styrene monooxygenase/indole monooxygenase family protein [Haloactinospora alba]
MEHEAGLDFWSDQAPEYNWVDLSLRAPGQPPLDISGKQSAGPGVSVERRVKMADWMEYFEDRGGKVVIHGVTVSDLDYFARMYDLVVVAVGSGELGELFPNDPSRSGGAQTGVLSQAILHGVAPSDKGEQRVSVISTPGGEVVCTPILTSAGPATSVFTMARPGSELDGSADVVGRGSEAMLRAMMGRLTEHVPDIAERCRDATLVDDNAMLMERIVPAVHRPVGMLPSGGLVMGMADAVVTSDPVSAQGWANSTICAQKFADAILARGEAPFDAAWMNETFDSFWEEQGKHAATFSQMVTGFWSGDVPDHFGELLPAVTEHQEIADRWISGFNDPGDYEKWMFDPDSCRDYISRVAQQSSE